MRTPVLLLMCAAAVSLAPRLEAQLNVNTFPSRAVGQNQREIRTTGPVPNLIEGREMILPLAVAVDRSTAPAAIYVADTGNHRVLGWRDALGFTNGQKADVVVGQVDFTYAGAQGPGTQRTEGLNSPTGLAVDGAGNLYVYDAGNNRILRFPRPLNVSADIPRPDMVIGQTALTTREANQGGVSAKTLASNTGQTFNASLAFDPQGNLWVTDPGNHRVLRYPVAVLNAGRNAPEADLVLGQPDFITNTPADGNAEGRLNRLKLRTPSGLAVDSKGRVYVGDGLSRVSVYIPPLTSGRAAARLMGVHIFPQGETPRPNATLISSPEGIFISPGDDSVWVADRALNRVLRFDPLEQWPAETATVISPPARAVIGQANFTDSDANRDLAEPTAATLSNPNGGTIFGNEMFIADSGNNRVLAYVVASAAQGATRVLGQDAMHLDSPNLTEGRELWLFNGLAGVSGQGGSFSDGAGVAIDRTSNPPRLYVADTYNHRVLGWRDARRASYGEKADIVIGQVDFQRTILNAPTARFESPSDASLALPAGIIVDAAGNLYVADSGNGRVLRFADPFGQYANNGGVVRANLVLGQTSFNVRQVDPSARIMGRPFGLAFTIDGHLAVSDAAHNRVLLFRRGAGGDFSSGQAAERVIGQPDFFTVVRGAGLNRFFSPRHIAIDTADRLYVADAGNNRIAIFDRITADRAKDDPVPVLNLGGLSSPHAVYVNQRTGEVWVGEPGTSRALRYPRFDLLALNSAPEYQIAAAGPLAITTDANDNVYVADAFNRVAIYHRGIAPVNAASGYDLFFAPGMIASLYPRTPGAQFGSETAGATSLPFPKQLGGVKVTVDGVEAPLIYVSPTQINMIVPMSVRTSGLAEINVLRADTNEILSSTLAQMSRSAPALFTVNQAGTGQVAALNQDNSVNSGTNRIPRGQVIQLFGTGQGPVAGAPEDGVAPPAIATVEKPFVIIGSEIVPQENIEYSGLAPGLPGVWQINVRIPRSTPPDANTDVVVQFGGFSNQGKGGQRIRTTIAVKE